MWFCISFFFFFKSFDFETLLWSINLLALKLNTLTRMCMSDQR